MAKKKVAMEVIKKVSSKKKMVTREQLVKLLGSGSTKPHQGREELSCQPLRRSPRRKQVTTLTPSSTGITTSETVRHSLFSTKKTSTEKTSSVPHKEGNLQSLEVVNEANASTLNHSRQECSLSKTQGGTDASKRLKSVNDVSASRNAPNASNTNGGIDGSSGTLMVMQQDVQVNNGVGVNSIEQPVLNTTNKRRLRATRQKNEKGRGCNKTKMTKEPVFVDVNEKLQPIGDSARELSSLIGCLARDPRRLPLDCFD